MAAPIVADLDAAKLAARAGRRRSNALISEMPLIAASRRGKPAAAFDLRQVSCTTAETFSTP
jgi:hypothetical protein